MYGSGVSVRKICREVWNCTAFHRTRWRSKNSVIGLFMSIEIYNLYHCFLIFRTYRFKTYFPPYFETEHLSEIQITSTSRTHPIIVIILLFKRSYPIRSLFLTSLFWLRMFVFDSLTLQSWTISLIGYGNQLTVRFVMWVLYDSQCKLLFP